MNWKLNWKIRVNGWELITWPAMRSKKKVKELGCSEICRIYISPTYYYTNWRECLFCLDTISLERSRRFPGTAGGSWRYRGSYDRLLHTIYSNSLIGPETHNQGEQVLNDIPKTPSAGLRNWIEPTVLGLSSGECKLSTGPLPSPKIKVKRWSGSQVFWLLHNF